jgi:hypothetical protein
MKEEPTLLIQVGRKGSHLLSHYKSRLEEKFLVTQLISLKNMPMFRARPALPSNIKTPVVIVSDTIHTAREMRNVLRMLKEGNTPVGKIFCYLRNEDGVAQLEEKKLVKKDSVLGLFSSSSEDEYMREAIKLHVFFRSRIEPMEPDLSYNQYNINKPLLSSSIIKLIEAPLSKAVGFRIFMHSVREKGLASNYGEVFFKITNKQYLSKTIQDFFNEGSSYKVRCLSVVIKMKRGHVDCDFDVVPKTEVSCKLSSNQIKQCIKKPNEQCLLRHTQYEKGDEESVRQTVCPQCVDEIAGEAFLNEFEPVLMKACTQAGLQCVLKRSYKPRIG